MPSVKCKLKCVKFETSSVKCTVKRAVVPPFYYDKSLGSYILFEYSEPDNLIRRTKTYLNKYLENA